jgi:predicted DNA-binding ribbon-helix-helix protein
VKRSIVIAGHKTSVSLEDAFWKVLKEIAIARGLTLSGFTTSIEEERQHGHLSSCLRLFVLELLPQHARGRVEQTICAAG